jgi:hypothetical protein
MEIIHLRIYLFAILMDQLFEEMYFEISQVCNSVF